MTAMSSRSRRAIRLQILDVENRHAAARFVSDLLVRGVEQRRDLKPLLPEARIVRQRQPEVARAHDHHAQMAIEAEDLPEVPAQFLDVVADTADAEFAKIGEVLPDLRGVEMELLGERLRGNRLHASGVEFVETPQVNREPVGSELRHLIGCLLALVQPIHKVQCYHPAPCRNGNRTCLRRESPAEFTAKAIVLGILFGLLFGASTVYLGLRAGLTVSASIPIAVLAISVLKKFGGSTILENNIVQTIGSAGESVAGGVVFTLPALIFLVPYGPAYFNYLQITMLTLAGGILGVLMMVPLRRALIVKEHGVLPYPEGTACAEVLVAGERGGKLAALVFSGLAVGGLWKALSWILNLFRTNIGYVMPRTSQFPNATLDVDISPEYLGVGYVIGPAIAGTMVAGGVLAWLGLLPLLTILGQYITVPFPPIHPNFALNPATGRPFLISEMDPGQLWSAYIRYIGAGGVLAAGLITLARTLPTIVSSARGSLKGFADTTAETAGAGADGTRHPDGRRPRRVPAARRLPGGHADAADPGQHRRGDPDPDIRLLLRDRLVAHHRPHRVILEPDFGDDDRDVDPDVRAVCRARLDR